MSDDLERRVVRAAEAALADQRFVSPVDVLVGLGWLAPSHVDLWRQCRIGSLEGTMSVGAAKLSAAMRVFQQWAQRRGLVPSETAYLARTRDRRSLRFSESGNPDVERVYRTHWLSPELSASSREGSPSARAGHPSWSSSLRSGIGRAAGAEAPATCC